VRAPGLEPGTFALSAQRATNCATPAVHHNPALTFLIHQPFISMYTLMMR